MSPVRSTVLALLAIGALGITNFLGTVFAHVLVPPQVYVLPTEYVEVPVIDQASCIELLAAEVNQPASNCTSCHPAGLPSTAPSTFDQFIIPEGELINGWLEIPAPNGADEDTGGIRRDRWIPGEAIGL